MNGNVLGTILPNGSAQIRTKGVLVQGGYIAPLENSHFGFGNRSCCSCHPVQNSEVSRKYHYARKSKPLSGSRRSNTDPKLKEKSGRAKMLHCQLRRFSAVRKPIHPELSWPFRPLVASIPIKSNGAECSGIRCPSYFYSVVITTDFTFPLERSTY